MPKPPKPVVRNATLIIGGVHSQASNAIRVGSLQWHGWLTENNTFVFEGKESHFTARREIRRGKTYWYGYRRRAGKLSKTYLGKSDELTLERLEQVSARLAGQIPLLQFPSGADLDATQDASANMPGIASSTALAHTTPSLLPLSKVNLPALPQKLIARPRLTQRITSPVTIIYAPSGFGKSTFLNEWRQSCGMPVGWVSLDANDNSPLRFWFTVLTALQTAYPAVGRGPLSEVRVSSAASVFEIVVSLSNEIIRATEGPGSIQRLGLILDDYHWIEEPEVHLSLQTFLEHLPPGFQLVISSHTQPPLALGYLRAKGIVTELGVDDLRFTLEEGIDFLGQHTPEHHLTYGDMQGLVQRTEGWVAGLHLATLALTQQGDRQQLMAAFTGTHTFLREYFMESVLYRQPPAVQSFLFKTSILKQLTGSLCDAVTGQTGGAEMLYRLWQENLFLARLEQQDWYRYHDLFAEMLHSQLRLQFPGEISRLHRRAATWYRKQNAPSDAVYHLLAIKAWEEAASLIEGMALHELAQLGEDSQFLRWLNQLPETVVQHHKTLLFVYLRVAEVGLSRAEVEQFLARVQANIIRKESTDRTPEEQDILTEIQQIRHAWETSGLAIRSLPAGGEHKDVWEMLNSLIQHHYYWRYDMEKAAAIACDTYETAQDRGNLFIMLVAGGGCAMLSCSQGYLRHSEKIARQVLEQALALRGKLPEPASIALLAMSRVYFGRNQLAQAHQFLLNASTVDPNPTSTNMPVMIAIQRALIQLTQGNGEAAIATLQGARELHTKRPSSLWLDQDLVAYQALCCLRQGDSVGADHRLSESNDVDSHPLITYVRAGILLEQKQAAAAEALLAALVEQYPHNFFFEPILNTRIMLAMALFEQRKVNQARQVMADAVRLAAPESFIRPFLDQGARIASLLIFMLETETLTA